MEPQVLEPGHTRRIYRAYSIATATFLGGPLATGYLIAENLKTLGQEHRVRVAWIISVLATIVIFGGLYLVPGTDKVPNQLIPLINSLVAYFIVEKIQGDKIKSYINATGKAFSHWRALGISLIAAVITFLPILVYVFLAADGLPSTNKSYGQREHKIYYEAENISEDEVDIIAAALTEANFFDDEQGKEIVLNKDDGKYVISIPLIENAWNNSEIVNYYTQLRLNVESQLSDSKVVLNLCSGDDINDVKKVLE